jgi:2-methylcitrate dehydratase PrpD
MTNPAETFARHALGATLEAMPPAAIHAAKTFILDTLGVGIAGAKAAHADDVLRAARGWGGAGISEAAHVWGSGARLPAPQAAFVNAFQIHCQEYDCVHEAAVVHPLATILSALIADVERAGPVSGGDFIPALAAAVDVATGLGIAVSSPIKFFRPATAGIFGATLGIARLRKLALETTMNALGYALAFASGTMQAHVEGKPALPVQIANASRGALMAIDLAIAGLPGPQDVFDGPFGYLSLFETTSDLAPVLSSLGKLWRIAEVSWKPFPTGRAAQGGIVAVQDLRAQGVTPENLVSLELSGPPIIKRLVGRPLISPLPPNHARLCFQYSGAVTLLRGTVGLEDFTPARLNDPVTHALGAKITVIDDGSPNPAAFTPQTAIATLTDGTSRTAHVEKLFGSPGFPLTHAQHLEKFRACAAFGGREAVADTLIRRCEALETEPDMAAIARLAAGRAA